VFHKREPEGAFFRLLLGHEFRGGDHFYWFDVK
jgi:hypothetical protein